MLTLIRSAAALLLIGLLAACATSSLDPGPVPLGVTSPPPPRISSKPEAPLAPFVGLLFF